MLNTYNKNEEIIEKGVPQSSKISKLERISWKFPSQLELGGAQLFGEQLVRYSSYITVSYIHSDDCVV